MQYKLAMSVKIAYKRYTNVCKGMDKMTNLTHVIEDVNILLLQIQIFTTSMPIKIVM